MKEIPVLESVKSIERQFLTGENPVLVMCSDMNAYVCKYMRSSSTAYKLACELIGICMSDAWHLSSPNVAFVRIKPSHWAGMMVPHVVSAPLFGSKRMDGVIDITPSTYNIVEPRDKTILQLMKIALFDFWIANEDRNGNNANLLYEVSHGTLVPIDYGCILNTATFDMPMSHLTMTDTILCSDLSWHLLKGVDVVEMDTILEEMHQYYITCLNRSRNQVEKTIEYLPCEWKVSKDIVEVKLLQLFAERWVEEVWNNFVEYLMENLNHG